MKVTKKLAKRVMDAAEYPHDPATEKRFVVWDTDCKGFGLRVYGSGRKVFVFRYEIAGRQRWIQIGDFGPMTAAQARDRAEAARVAVNDGKDPAEQRRQRRLKAKTIRDLADEYMEELEVKPSTERNYRQLLKGHILPAFGNRQPRSITVSDVRQFKAKRKETPYAANRALFLLAALLERGGIPRGDNPARAGKEAPVKRYMEKARKRYLDADELARFGKALRKLEAKGKVSRPAAGALRLLLFTGCRVNEILHLRWEDIDFAGGRVTIREHKTDSTTGEPKVIPLTPPALDVLKGLPRVDGNPWVIPGQRVGSHITELARPWERVLKAAKIEAARPHDLRHTAGSWAASGGASLLLVGGMLGHKQASSTERYAHVQPDPVREVATRTSEDLAAALEGKTADVVELHGGKR